MISFILNKIKNYLLRGGGRAMGKMRIEGGHGNS